MNKFYGDRQLVLSDKRLIIAGLLMQIFTILRPIKNETITFCNFYITRWIFNVHLDCDAQYYLLDAQHPGRVLTPETPLQDRAAFTLAASAMFSLLRLIGISEFSVLYSGEDSIVTSYSILAYSVFLIMNACILAFSIKLLLTIINSLLQSSGAGNIVKLVAWALICLNPITREFFWTPHTQIFNIMIPILIYQFYFYDRSDARRTIFIISPALLSFFYPAFLTLIPLFFFIELLNRRYRNALICLFTAIPYLSLPMLIELLGGKYRNWVLEEHRRFVWLLDSAKEGNFLGDLNQSILEFAKSFVNLSIVSHFFAALCVLTVLLIQTSRSELKVLLTAFTPLIYFLAIMYFNGDYALRFSFGAVILLFLVSIRGINSKETSGKIRFLMTLSFILIIFYWCSATVLRPITG